MSYFYPCTWFTPAEKYFEDDVYNTHFNKSATPNVTQPNQIIYIKYFS